MYLNRSASSAYASIVCSSSEGHICCNDSFHGWCMVSNLCAVALHKIFALEGHAVLDGNTATQRFDPLKVSIANRFRTVQNPIDTVNRK